MVLAWNLVRTNCSSVNLDKPALTQQGAALNHLQSGHKFPPPPLRKVRIRNNTADVPDAHGVSWVILTTLIHTLTETGSSGGQLLLFSIMTAQSGVCPRKSQDMEFGMRDETLPRNSENQCSFNILNIQVTRRHGRQGPGTLH